MQASKKINTKFFVGPILIGFLIDVMLKVFQLIADHIGVGSEYAELLTQTKYSALGLVLLIYFVAVVHHIKQRKKS